jgi:putative alpha-1,2-mannosidase
MGFYPVCPGTTQYVFGTPLFRKMTLSFENGKKLVIQAPATDKNTYYIHNISLNGTAHTKNWIDHSQLQKGGTLLYDVKKTPSYTRGTTPAAYPFSVTPFSAK